jgi:hypothetical protein
MTGLFTPPLNDADLKALTASCGSGPFYFAVASLWRSGEGFPKELKQAYVFGEYPELVQALVSAGVDVVGKRKGERIPKTPRKTGYFTGKRVALIGPAPHITSRNQSRKLSGYDAIVRVNRTYPVKPDLARTTTGRTDVWYPALPIVRYEINVYLSQDPTPPFVRTEALDWEYPEAFNHLLQPWSFTRWQCDEATGCSSNRGMIAIMDIMAENPAELYITGITFYQTGAYFDGYLHESQAKHAAHTEAVKGHIGTHNPSADLLYFAKHIATLPNVKVDKELQNVLSEHATVPA